MMALLQFEKEVLQRLDRIEELLTELKEERALEPLKEISASKACRMLSIGYDTLLREINSGKLRARKMKSGSEIRYRIKIADIKAYQETNIVSRPAEQNYSKLTGQQIWDEIQGKKKRK